MGQLIGVNVGVIGMRRFVEPPRIALRAIQSNDVRVLLVHPTKHMIKGAVLHHQHDKVLDGTWRHFGGGRVGRAHAQNTQEDDQSNQGPHDERPVVGAIEVVGPQEPTRSRNSERERHREKREHEPRRFSCQSSKIRLSI